MGATLIIGHNPAHITNLVLEQDEVLFLDTKGLSAQILQHIPKHRINNTIYFNPSDKDFSLAYNPLSDFTLPDDKALDILFTFRSLFHNSWGPQLEMILTAGLRAVLDNPNPSFLRLYTLLHNSYYRRKQSQTDPLIRQFWNTFDGWEDKEKFLRTQSTINKLFAFLHHRPTRYILSQDNKLQFNNNTVLVDLSDTPIDIQRLLGSLLAHNSQHLIATDAERFVIPHRENTTLEYTHYPKTDWTTLQVIDPKGIDFEVLCKELRILPLDLERLEPNQYIQKADRIDYHPIQPNYSKPTNNLDQIIDQTRRRYCTKSSKVAHSTSAFILNYSGRRSVSIGNKKRKKNS